MTRVAELVDEYVAKKRSLGYLIDREGYTLGRLASYTEDSGYEGPVCSELAISWIESLGEVSEKNGARLYETARTFSRYACEADAESTMLPKGPRAHWRTEPFIYTDGDAARHMEALASIHSPDGLRAASASAMCGLMLSCGLRPSECIRLAVSDYDAGSAVITVKHTKFGRSRLVPVSDSTAAFLEGHLTRIPYGPELPLFPRTGGRPFDIRALDYAWQITRDVLLPEGKASWDRRPPRPYDARHSMATRTLERWIAEGLDVDAMMPRLMTYLGHRKIADTYWYLTATPALLDAASEKFARYAMGGAE